MSSVKALQAVMELEMKRLEATASNVSNLDNTFKNKLDVVGNKTVSMEIPSIEEYLEGNALNGAYRLKIDETDDVETVIKNQGGNLLVLYKSDTKIEEEMVKLGEIKRAYEASLRLLNLSKKLNEQALQIGKS
ncbi:TPA: hypothetical protein RQK93_000691 [Vibrio vulnificus]|nr:hypothetical protein [Vibrio vulnificus]EJP4175459.1 hypothetical protein [Vibrio vulnificus]ELX4197051.1 hypothetical protein [Vibrio vulnificus]HDY8068498.1 hypothetical protein [Vibrio vulnificus]